MLQNSPDALDGPVESGPGDGSNYPEGWSSGSCRARLTKVGVHPRQREANQAEIQADAYLGSDPRRRIADVRDELEFELATFRENRKLERKAMLAGGASKKNVSRYNSWLEKWIQGLLKDDESLRNDTTFGAGGLYIVAGAKQ